MKTQLLLFFALLSSFVFAQIETELRIYHRLGADPYSWNTEVQNNLGQSFKITRLSYYMTRFSVVHDGGQVTNISDDTVALIKANDWWTAIQLGELNITSVEEVRFHIGVYAPVNNEDPSLYPPEHPLAPQNPAMHWGWISGYRFLAYEATSGVNFAQLVELHALGNHNYFETTVVTGAQISNGKLVIALDADYLEGVHNIHLSDGVIAHGIDEEDLDALLNFRDRVFSERTGELSVHEHTLSVFTLFPNPTQTGRIELKTDINFDQLIVRDVEGRVVYRVSYDEMMDGTIDLGQLKGVYFVGIHQNGRDIETQRIVLL